MKRKGLYRPTVEDAVEISGIEILHPGGFELTKRTAELCELREGMNVLDVSSGRGTLAMYYAKNYGVNVTGLDISEEMVKTATKMATNHDLSNKVKFILGIIVAILAVVVKGFSSSLVITIRLTIL